MMPLRDFVERVRVTIDENRRESGYLEDNPDNLELDGIIRSKTEEAARLVCLSSPSGLLEPEPMPVPDAAQYAETDGSGYVVLPPDFLRMVSFRLTTWNRDVTSFVAEDSREGLMQKCLFTRGTPLKPVCVLSHDMAGNRILEYYTAGFPHGTESSGKCHRIDRALYVRVPKIILRADVEMIGLSPLLVEATVNYCAALTEYSRGNEEAAKVFLGLAASSMNL